MNFRNSAAITASRIFVGFSTSVKISAYPDIRRRIDNLITHALVRLLCFDAGYCSPNQKVFWADSKWRHSSDKIPLRHTCNECLASRDSHSLYLWEGP